MSKITQHLPTAARILLGLAFFVFGLNGFLQFLPNPTHEGASGAFLGALAATGYMFPLVKGTEVVAGALLLSGRAVPFALTILAPILVNIVAFHLLLEPAGTGLVVVLLALEVFLAWTYRDVFAPLFTARGRVSRVSVPDAHPSAA